MDATQWWIVYQPLIVGLGAVALAVLGNTVVAGLQHRWAKQKEIVILRRTLLLELRLLHSYLQNLLGSLQGSSNQADFAFPTEFPNLEQSAARMGYLPWDEGFEVSKAVGALFLFMEALGTITVSSSKRYQTLKAVDNERRQVAQVALTARDRAADAIAILEKGKL